MLNRVHHQLNDQSTIILCVHENFFIEFLTSFKGNET